MSKQPKRVPVSCICGANLVPLDDDTEYPMWVHEPFTGLNCKTPVPAAGMPTKADRRDLSILMDQTGQRLAQAGDEIRALKAQADATLRRLEALDQAHLAPERVRRATLNQVWDRLVDEGQMGAAAIVMRMIGSTNEGDWS